MSSTCNCREKIELAFQTTVAVKVFQMKSKLVKSQPSKRGTFQLPACEMRITPQRKVEQGE